MEHVDGSCSLLLWPAGFHTCEDSKETRRWALKVGALVLLQEDRGEGPTGSEDEKEGRRDRGRGQDAEWGLKSLKYFFYFRGSADVKEIRIQSLSLIRRDNVVILNPEPRFIHICGCQKEPFVLFLTHFCFHRWLQMHSWHPCHLKPHEVANAYSDGFILKMGLCSLLHLTLGYNSN